MMLTGLQYSSPAALSCEHKREVYRLHMCGLCHALGDGYGLPTRLLTTHEMILLNVLISAQSPAPPDVATRRCPLNPLRTVQTNTGIASQVAAAAALEATSAGLLDKIEDGDPFSGLARAANTLLQAPLGNARRALAGSSVDLAPLRQITIAQNHTEAQPTTDPAEPTARAAGHIFAETARLSDAASNSTPLRSLGEAFGAYLYLNDAFHDLADDLRRGAFNPLSQFAIQPEKTVQLSAEGIEWLRGRLVSLRASIEQALAELHLHRYRSVLHDLLITPVDRLIAAVEGNPIGKVCAVHRSSDQQESSRRRKRQPACSSSDCCFIYYEPHCICDCCFRCSDCADCCDCDGDGVCCDCDGGCCCDCDGDGSCCDCCEVCGDCDCDCGDCDCGGCD